MAIKRTGLAMLALLVCLGADDNTDTPKEVGLVERSEAKLAQLDITAIGPPEVVSDLKEEDFKISLSGNRLESFKLDRLCEAVTEAPPGAVEEKPAAPPASYLFYFDQSHLTMAGRQRALDLALEVAGELLNGSHRAMIVSNARRLEIIEPLTSEFEKIAVALDRLEHDREQWDFYTELEESRLGEVMRALNDQEDLYRALSIARVHQKEERWRTDQNLRRLEIAMGQLAGVDAPKAVIYFADSMRSNPGEHYMSFFGNALRETATMQDIVSADSLMGNLPFDRVVNEAAALGIRIYTVQAEGLAGGFDRDMMSVGAQSLAGTSAPSSRVRVTDAQRALSNLAAETGGKAFLNGVPGPKMIERITADSSCVYLASFDPTEIKKDRPLRVVVKTDKPEVELRVRGRLIVQSESARMTSRLLRAFASAGDISDPFEIRVGLMPTEFRNGAYSALLQVGMPGMPLQDAVWDIGSSVILGEKVRDEVSGRINVSAPGTVVVLEKELEIKPGAYEITSVAHESRSGLVASDFLKIDWPTPQSGTATLSHVALLQPSVGAFSRDEQIRSSGSIIREEFETVRTGKPAALVTLVCRGRRNRGFFTVQRSLTGESAQEFDPLEVDLQEDRCAQVRDVIPENSMGPGYYLYEVRVMREDETLDERSRLFLVE
jgi:VWFA-related protein